MTRGRHAGDTKDRHILPLLAIAAVLLVGIIGLLSLLWTTSGASTTAMIRITRTVKTVPDYSRDYYYRPRIVSKPPKPVRVYHPTLTAVRPSEAVTAPYSPSPTPTPTYSPSPAPSPTPTPTPVITPTGNLGEQVAAYARIFTDGSYYYEYGGTGPTGFDCSGLAMTVYAHFGISIPRTSEEQAGSLQGTSDPQPGDLVFYWSGNDAFHTAIYEGNGMVVSALDPGHGIVETSVSYPGSDYSYGMMP